MYDEQKRIEIDEIEKLFIIQIMNNYMAELIEEGCPQTMISYLQSLKEKLIKVLDKQDLT